MEAILDLADNWLNLRRVDLGVLSINPAAENLYLSFGFEHEGARRAAVFSEGKLIDEQIMARLRGPLPEVERGPAPQFARRTDVVDVAIRPLRTEDAEAIHEIRSDPAVARGLNQVPSLELADVLKKVEAGGPGLYRYSAVAEHEDGSQKVVGSASLRRPQNPRLDHAAHLGLAVHRNYWGIGIGNRLMSAVVQLADQWMNLSRLELDVYTDNDVAIHLYERHGFEIEGTRRLHSYGDGRWSDAHFMARLRAP
jgi:putative acetyltransferase